MEYIIIFTLCVLSTLKVSFQGSFSKQTIKTTSDAVFFNGMTFLVSAVLFAYRLADCEAAVWIYASFGATFTVMFQLFYAKALSVGNVSLTVLIVNLSMVINVMVSYFAYGEPMSVLRFSGLILTVAAFLLCTEFKSEKAYTVKWMIFAIGAMLSTAGLSVVQQIFGKSIYSEYSQAFVSCMYIVSVLISVIVYLILCKNSAPKSFCIGRKSILFALAVGVSLSLFQVLNTYAISRIDGTFFFPALTGGVIVLSTVSGVLVFKDRLKFKQIISIIIGIVAIVLMNF